MSKQKILIVEDDVDIREALVDIISDINIETVDVGSVNEGLAALSLHDFGLIISDINMAPKNGLDLLATVRAKFSEMPVLLITAYGSVSSAVKAMQLGASDYILKPFEATVIINAIETHFANTVNITDNPICTSKESIRMFDLAGKVAKTNATVLLLGESGTGKEVLSRYIHSSSYRSDKPFVAINCAAIPENMLEATLFGYEKGAFTGAHKASPGKFEQAQGGTLLLDEISEMELGLQAKLLRVLQEQEVERLGGQKTIPLDVRVIATTNRDLKNEVNKGHFREDLYYRLNVFPIMLAPLRQRTDDIEPLVIDLIERNTTNIKDKSQYVSAEAMQMLLSYQWPGNIRELENVVQRALILSENQMIQKNHILIEEQIEAFKNEECPSDLSASLSRDLKVKEFDLIVSALKEANGSRKETAEQLGISPRTLRYKLAQMRKLGICVPGDAAIQTV